MRLPFRRRRPAAPAGSLTVVPDSHPKRGLYTEPVRITSLHMPEPELLDDGRWRASFQLTVKDADGRRCSDIYVRARVTGPERSAAVEGTTDLMGQIRFRMSGPAGTYGIEVLDVAAGGLDWDIRDSQTSADQVVAG